MKPEDISAPLRLQKVKCHCCRTFVELIILPDLGSRMYYPKEKEDDQHVKEWEWKNPAFSQINPYHYEIFFCPNCSYSDFRDEFMNPEINPSNKMSVIREKFLEEMKNSGSLVSVFSKKIPLKNMDFASAVYLHLLAICAQELLPGPAPQDNPRQNRDWKKLARLYLRCAWLFREENPEGEKEKKNEGFIFNLRVSIDDLLKNLTQFKKGVGNLVNNMEDQQKFEQEGKIYKKDTYLNYKANLQSAIRHFGQLNNSVVHLKEVNDKHMCFIKDKAPLMGEGFYAFKDELLTNADNWPDIPTSEVDCLKKAADHFRLAADNDRYLSEIEAIKMLEFGVMLLSRAGLKKEKDELYKIFMRRASDVRASYMKKKAGTKSMVDQEMFNAEINKVNKIIQDVSFIVKSGAKDEKKE